MKYFIITCFALLACNGSSKDHRYNEAIILHNSMIKKANMIEHHLNEMTNDSSLVSFDSLRILKKLLNEWKADLVEVPGNQDHSHHDHPHSHQPIPDVTNEQMLAIQRELDDRLSKIGDRLTALKPDFDDAQHNH